MRTRNLCGTCMLLLSSAVLVVLGVSRRSTQQAADAYQSQLLSATFHFKHSGPRVWLMPQVANQFHLATPRAFTVGQGFEYRDRPGGGHYTIVSIGTHTVAIGYIWDMGRGCEADASHVPGVTGHYGGTVRLQYKP